MIIQEVADLIEQYAPRSSGVAGDELGLLVGDPGKELTGVVTCWSATAAVLKQAADLGANLVIAHEPLTYRICGRNPEANLLWYEESHPTAKLPNQKRLAVAMTKGLTIYRYHSNWDFAPRYGMGDMLAGLLELGSHPAGEQLAPVYTIAQTSVAELTERARRQLQLGPLRVVGEPSRVVSRVAICLGGLGQMFTFPEVAVRGGAEAAFFGEMLDYTMRFCVESGLAAIELGHYQSEQPGMMGMAQFLRERLPPQVPVQCLPSGEAWAYA